MYKKLILLCFLFIFAGQTAYCQADVNNSDMPREENANNNPENLPSMSLDGAALNQLLPVPESPAPEKPAKSRPPEKTKNKHFPPKNNNPAPKKEEGQEQKTVIPKMTPVKWIYSITGKNSSHQKAIKNSSCEHEQVWEHNTKNLMCKCGHSICTPEARMNDIKLRQGALCCPVIVWDEIRETHIDLLPPPVIVNPQKDYDGHKIVWDDKQKRYRCSCGHVICTEGKRFNEKRHGKGNCCPILVWTDGYDFSARISPTAD